MVNLDELMISGYPIWLTKVDFVIYFNSLRNMHIQFFESVVITFENP